MNTGKTTPQGIGKATLAAVQKNCKTKNGYSIAILYKNIHTMRVITNASYYLKNDKQRQANINIRMIPVVQYLLRFNIVGVPSIPCCIRK